MNRWTWPALVITSLAGVATCWYSVQLQQHTLDGLPPRELNLGLLGLSILPTGLLLAASAIRWRSASMQITILVVAVIVGLVRVSIMRGELDQQWTHGSGLTSGLAWGGGMVAAAVLLLTAGLAEASEWAERRKVAFAKTAPEMPPSNDINES